MTEPNKVRIAYFSMEVAVSAEFPTYNGGLGILTGDTLRSAADLDVPIAAVTLAHREGYFSQRLESATRAEMITNSPLTAFCRSGYAIDDE